ncbi:hypothetical protein TRVL_07780 [Trypanosoma vivax]|nr:hypothetical protein TRVL_07780 [Trypanosoma vivax]
MLAEKAKAVCSLMRQLNGARSDLLHLILGALENSVRAVNAGQKASEAETCVVAVKGRDAHLTVGPVAAAFRSMEESKCVKERSEHMKKLVWKDVQSILHEISSLKGDLIYLINHNKEHANHMINSCEDTMGNVTGETVKAAMEQYSHMWAWVVVRVCTNILVMWCRTW